MKKFNELTKSGQRARLQKYEKERQERGTTQVLARLAQPVKFKECKNGALNAFLRLAINEKGKETEFITVSHYVKPEKINQPLHNWLKDIKVGQLLSVEYKEANGWKNAYTIMEREAKKEEPAKAPLSPLA